MLTFLLSALLMFALSLVCWAVSTADTPLPEREISETRQAYLSADSRFYLYNGDGTPLGPEWIVFRDGRRTYSAVRLGDYK